MVERHAAEIRALLEASLPVSPTPPATADANDVAPAPARCLLLCCWLLSLRLLGEPLPPDATHLRRRLEARRELLWGAPLSTGLVEALLPGVDLTRLSPATLASIWPILDAAIAAAAAQDGEDDVLGRTYEALRETGKRRGQGSYYTPAALVDAILDETLSPTLSALPDPLALRLVDPACGSGRFLVSAARRLRAHLDSAGDPAAASSSALVGMCLYGVDRDPLAVALCRVRLCAEGLDPAHVIAHIRQGDALLGSPEFQVDADAALDLADLQAAARWWDAAFPGVAERGGFDVVVGNPPWIAHAGRASQPLPPGVKAYLRAAYPSFAGYPTTHGAFVLLGARLLREGGRLGLVLPASVSELGGYRPTRQAHDQLCTFSTELVDFGEGRFVGVTQPCIALVSQRTPGGRQDAPPGAPWPVARPDLGGVSRALLARLSALPRLPADLFGERGIQSDRRLRSHFRETAQPADGFDLPLREGSDIREFCLLPPRIHACRAGLGGRLRPAASYAEVALLVRQTARYPVAVRSDGSAFRNSLLAVFGGAGWPAGLLLALLNASVVRWQHYMRFRDARQPILPQLKISHLRQIPAPPALTPVLREELMALSDRLSRRNAGILEAERARLDDVVAAAYRLSDAEYREVCSWWARLRPPLDREAPAGE